MWAAATSRTARALAMLAAAVCIVFVLISWAERMGHAYGSRLIDAFDVSYAGSAIGLRTTELRNEAYQYAAPNETREVRFSADIGPLVQGYAQPVLLLTDAYAFVSVRLNGIPLSDQGGRDGPIPDRQLEPRLYYLTSAIQTGAAKQILTIDVKADGTTPRLREAFVSDISEGIFAYRTRRFISVEGVVAATAIAVFAGLLSLAVTPLLEYRTLSGLFAAMMLFWAVRNFTYAGPISDFPWPWLQGIYFASTFLILVTTVLLINAWTANNIFVRRMFTYGLAGMLFALYIPVALDVPGGVALIRQIGNVVGVACFAMMIGQLTWYLIKTEHPPWLEMFLFMACLCVGVIEIGGDGLPDLTRAIWPETGLSMAYGPLMPLPLAAGMLVNFVRRTVSMRNQLRMDNATLAGLVAAREAEIAKVYAEREVDVRQSALMMERQRIMRDMHDGIGSQLLGLLFQARGQTLKPDELTQGLQESLDDLNLVVESLDQSDHGLAEALGAFRARIAPKCEAAGVALVWEMGDLGAIAVTGPARVLQVYRILQEACINALRHGRPKSIRIGSGLDPDRPDSARIVIEDDGAGFDVHAPQKRGRGLSNMRRRAEAAGGSLHIESMPGRTRLTIRMPATSPP